MKSVHHNDCECLACWGIRSGRELRKLRPSARFFTALVMFVYARRRQMSPDFANVLRDWAVMIERAEDRQAAEVRRQGARIVATALSDPAADPEA
jgi:hypothetical protein